MQHKKTASQTQGGALLSHGALVQAGLVNTIHALKFATATKNCGRLTYAVLMVSRELESGILNLVHGKSRMLHEMTYVRGVKAPNR